MGTPVTHRYDNVFPIDWLKLLNYGLLPGRAHLNHVDDIYNGTCVPKDTVSGLARYSAVHNYNYPTGFRLLSQT